MSTEPLVSIALPALNAERTIGQAVQSIMWQTYSRWELLLADDGSTDETLRIVGSFRDARIRVLPSAGRDGLSGRLNACIDQAEGSLLARMDADDISYPARIEKQVAFLQANPKVDLTAGQAIVFGTGGRAIGKRTGPYTHELITRRPLQGFRMAHPTWMGRLEWFRRYRYDPGAIRCEDHELLFRAFRDSVYANLPDVLLGYREDGLDLSKILLSRWVWLKRAAQSRGEVASLPRLVNLAVVTGLKAVVDCVAAVSGLQHRLARQRAGKMSGKEREEWDLIWRRSQEPFADIGVPAANL